jgi:four helix bundle protein
VKITKFEDIDAWKAARKLMKSVYDATKGREFTIDTDLRRQIRRAAVSAMSNVAEGFDASSDLEFRRFLRISRRSVSEVQSHLYVALDQEYIEQAPFQRLYDQSMETKRLIGGFIRYLDGRKKT